MKDSLFYLGPELDRSVIRTDFFRLFKAMSLNYEYQYFLLSCVIGDEGGVSLQHEHSIYSLPDGYSMIWKESAGTVVVPYADRIDTHFKRSTTPMVIDVTSYSSDLIQSCGCEVVTVVPLHTFNARRYCLVLLGDGEWPSRERLALTAFDAATIFQRYDEAIISLDTITALSGREIEVVRWTADGKTSAEIAIILGLSSHTVNTYITSALRKLGVVNRAQMVASALRRGLIN
jgi:DNA-binding CsgD family transcriptional regulator